MTFQETANRLHELDEREKELIRPPKLALYRIKTEKFGILLISACGIKEARRIAWSRFQVGPRNVWRKGK